MLNLLGNILWLIFGGLLSGLAYIIGGLLTCLTIVGIPFGIQAMKLGVAMFFPFGKEVRTSPDADSPLRIVLNVIWLILFGWEIALNHLFWALVLGITIIGIPFAMQHVKMIPLSLLPFGRSLE
jgi:uncharacterized membrane protein YccF (DUF307 family)